MSRNRCCCNCRHNIRCKEKPKSNITCYCDIDDHYIGYIECFEGWCKHWSKDHTFDEVVE